MLGIPILDVAVGLTFVYLVLSLAVTAANEMFAAWFKRRAWMLRKGLVNLLEDEKLAGCLMNHPLIRGLYEPRGLVTSKVPFLSLLFGNGPSYVPSRTFAVALLDMVAPLVHGKREPSSTKDVGPVAAVIDLLHEEADGDDEKLKENLEVWFNDSMERVSGWYKRRTQVISLLFAAVITVGTNADTIVIAKALWNDPALRQAVVERADRYVREQPTRNSAQITEDDAAPPPPLPPDQQADVDFDEASAQFQAALADLEELQLPIGWEQPRTVADREAGAVARLVRDDTTDDWPGAIWPLNDANDWAKWLRALDDHTLGWLITIFAVSLGAPFWFDMLNKVVSIRSAGKAPEESPKSPKQIPQPRAPGAQGSSVDASPVRT